MAAKSNQLQSTQILDCQAKKASKGGPKMQAWAPAAAAQLLAEAEHLCICFSKHSSCEGRTPRGNQEQSAGFNPKHMK
jgi:hypothetical protein